MIINLRGANGSGKSTIARAWLKVSEALEPVNLVTYQNDKGKEKFIKGTINHRANVCIVGSYETACGGLDGIPSFALSFQAITRAKESCDHVICEGVLSSTVFGSWAEYAKAQGDFAFVYLSTPLEECLRRIYVRNGGKKIKEELVKAKVNAIAATRKKAIAAGFLVYDLPETSPEIAVAEILIGIGDCYRAR